MVEVGGKPILWHIMKQYSHYGFSHFIVALGYRGEYIKRYVVDYCALSANLTVNLKDGSVIPHEGQEDVREDWTVELVDTGLDTQIGGRMRGMAPYFGNGTCMMT